MVKEILKFMTPSCGQCKLVSKMFQGKGYTPKEIDCTLDENTELVNKYHVSHVPFVVVINSDDSIKCLNNIPEIRDWLSHH